MSKAKDDTELMDEVEQQQFEEDLQAVMNTEAGRRVMWAFLAECRVFQECNTGNSQTFTNLGRRSIGLWLMDKLTSICPEKYLEMYSYQLMRIQSQNQQEEESDG